MTKVSAPGMHPTYARWGDGLSWQVEGHTETMLVWLLYGRAIAFVWAAKA